MSKVVMIGIDGASWRVIDYLLKHGELPAFKNLIQEGFRNVLLNYNMLHAADPWEKYYLYREYQRRTPRLGSHPDVRDWMTLATGATPLRHGVTGSTEKNSRGIEMPSSCKKRKKPTVWEILARNDKKIGIIGWMANWPLPALKSYAIARIPDITCGFSRKGNQDLYSNLPAYNRKDFVCHPAYPAALWGDLKKIGFDKEINTFINKLPAALKDYFRPELMTDSLCIEWTKHLLKRFPQPDFLSFLLCGVHSLSHLFWDCLKIEEKNFSGAIHQRRRKNYGSIIEDYYKFIDRRISEILRLLGKDSIIMIVSDHGMVNSRITKKYLLMDNIYYKLGFLKLSGDAIDWDATSVYDNQNPWGIFAIRKGYIKGENPGKIFAALKRKVKKIRTSSNERLFSRLDFNTGDNSFTIVPNYKAIRRSTRIYINNKAIPLEKAIHFIPHYSLHSPEGIIIISGNNIKAVYADGSAASCLDVAPTILHFLGVRHVDKDMEGKVMLSVKRRL